MGHILHTVSMHIIMTIIIFNINYYDIYERQRKRRLKCKYNGMICKLICFSIQPCIVKAAPYSTVYSELIKTRTYVCLSVQAQDSQQPSQPSFIE